MKITEETRIKDLIPEGYKLFDHSEVTGDSKGRLVLKYKKEKDKFEQYVEEYVKEKGHSFEYLNFNYEDWDFEFRVGLLKHICDNNGYSFLDVLYDFNLLSISGGVRHRDTEVIAKVLPKDFIDYFRYL